MYAYLYTHIMNAYSYGQVDPQDESTRDLSYMKNKPIGPFTLDPAELAASKDWDPEDRAALFARRVLPFER
mgnify:CR=1 FL=1